MNKRLTKISKFLSFVLRHDPAAIGVQLDSDGWLAIDSLVAKSNAYGKSITVAQVHEVIEGSEEKRFALSDDGLRIRAT